MDVGLPHPVLDALTAHESVRADEVVVDRRLRHYKSSIVLLRCGDDAQPRYVVKIEDAGSSYSAWSPEREFEGLRFIEDHLRDIDGFGVIEAVAWGEAPPFLISRFQPGESLRPLIDRAARGREIERAERYIQHIGRWTRALHDAKRSEGGNSPEEIRRFVQERITELKHIARFREAGERIGRAMEALLAGLHDAERARMTSSHYSHGDLAPQNFLLNEGILYPLDLEGFRLRAVDIDVYKFRTRLEKQSLPWPWRAPGTPRLWNAFLRGYTPGGGLTRLIALHYLHGLIAALAWHSGKANRLGRMSGIMVSSRLRDRLWIRQRARWAAALPTGAADIAAYVRDRL